jgi:hypothetical protein
MLQSAGEQAGHREVTVMPAERPAEGLAMSGYWREGPDEDDFNAAKRSPR